MALVELGLSRHGPSLSQRSEALENQLPAVEAAIISGQISGSWTPGILAACTNRLTGVFSAARVDSRLRPLLPWIARQMVEQGEVVMLLDNDLTLRPVSEYELHGTGESRIYNALTINGPTQQTEYRRVTPEQVVHAVIRPLPMMPWRGEHWRQSTGFTSTQLAALDRAILQDAAAARGTILPIDSDDPAHKKAKMLGQFLRLRGGLAMHPLSGRESYERQGPPPRPLRLQSADMAQLREARESLAADFAESLGFSRVTLGIGQGGQVSRPDGLRSWVASTATGWATILGDEVERVLESPVVIDFEPVLSRLVPFGQRLTAAARLVDKGWPRRKAERLAGLR